MLSEKELLYASSTVLTGILILFTLLSYSIYDQHDFLDKKFELETSDQELDEIIEKYGGFVPIENPSNLNSKYTIIAVYVNEDTPQKIIDDIRKKSNETDQLRDQIQEIESDTIELNILKNTWETPHRWITAIIGFLGITILLVLFHSLWGLIFKNTEEKTSPALIGAHISFGVAWIFIIGLARVLQDISF